MKDTDILDNEELIQLLRHQAAPRPLPNELKAQTLSRCLSAQQHRQRGSLTGALLIAACLLCALLVPRFDNRINTDSTLVDAPDLRVTWDLGQRSQPYKRLRLPSFKASPLKKSERSKNTRFRQRADRLAQQLSSIRIQF